MKRIYAMLLLTSLWMSASGMPAKRGVWKTLTLADGTRVEARLAGDEHLHYWAAADGRTFMAAEGQDYMVPVQKETLENRRLQKSTLRQQARRQRARKAGEFGRPTSYKGSKKGIIILVESPSKKFYSKNTREVFDDMANKEGYTDNYGSIGSVHDYFKSQSNGQFDLTFDVVGPVTVSHEMNYYAGSDGTDLVHEMIIEACQLVNDQVRWSDYDWNDDGLVDQVYVMFAGKGQADGGGSSTIWPHEYELSWATATYDKKGNLIALGDPLELQGMYIDTYACGQELDGSSYTKHAGIGTLCHEFTHCLGLPDFYDTRSNGTNFGMATWSLMDYGSYNGGGYVPPSYTGYERWFCGWIEPKELTEETEVTGMQSLSDFGDVYIIYNQKHRDEYFILQNIQQKGWDSKAYGSGLLVMHVDYDYNTWINNEVNNTASRQRCTIVPADNNFNDTSTGLAGDPYPTATNNTLSNFSRPAAKFYNKNTDGTYYANVQISNITQNADGTISFNFSPTSGEGQGEPVVEPTGDYIFYESFDKCSGTGGNDNLWSGSIASAAFVPDNEGWTTITNSQYGANRCARFGKRSSIGMATSPSFTLEGTTTLSFKAAAWGTESCQLVLYVNGKSLESFNLTNMKWGEYSVEITGNGSTTLTFQPTKNLFFLDEVLVAKPVEADPTAIQSVSLSKASTAIYTLDGRRINSDFSHLRPGIYIVNGRKVVR